MAFHRKYDKGYPSVGLLGKTSGKFDYYVKFTPPPKSKVPIIPIGWDDSDSNDENFLPSPKPPR